MLSIINAPLPPASFRLEVGPLTSLQACGHAEAPPLRPYYSVVLVAAPPAGHRPPPGGGPGQLYFGGPGQLAQVLAQLPAHSPGQVLRFTDDFLYAAGEASEPLLSLFHNAPLTTPLPLPAGATAEIAFLLAHLAQQATGDALLREALLRSYLQTLLLRCISLHRQHYPRENLARPGLFLRFRQLLEQYYTEWKSVTAYADQLCVTPNHLSVSIKRETGRPASDHIRQRIMLEAQRLVAARDAPLKEIAYQLGFEDVAHFSKLFKRCHGVSFSSFKAHARQQYAGPVAA